uniref:Glycosyl transferase, group 2 domain protein n=1 Tax=uncultured bacterium UPO43 TaxID=1776968 RepID=A0A126SXZ8_9BACT|nr:glycosyl transferase, group 2 domain protein [uncultured bacterium UPO43]
MATVPFFALSPNAVVSLLGLTHGPDPTVPTPREDWRQATVNVVIPALNEQENIALCLASVLRQTKPPERIILIDDGSSDATLEFAQRFCAVNNLPLTTVHRAHPIGKTPTIKRQAREFPADVEFILDADTILESENYIARTVEELYKGLGIASACGTILPLRQRDRHQALSAPAMQAFIQAVPQAAARFEPGRLPGAERAVTNLYRDVLYLFLQRFVYRGQMAFFGSIINPVGCAVAYRQAYVKDLFDRYEPILGDDLTNSEDIFIGFALVDQGYRNIQLTDVYARSLEPESPRVPRQLYLWSSSFLQSCYYFDELLRSPFKGLRRHRQHHQTRAGAEQRQVREQYRQPFGLEYSRRYGRPLGWSVFMAAAEKIFFPTILLIMVLRGLWTPLAITLAVESALFLGILTFITKGQRLMYLGKGLLVTPLRYGSLAFDLVTITRFASDLWLRRNRRWRK